MPKIAGGTRVRESDFPEWVKTLYNGRHNPQHSWTEDLEGCETWHEQGCTTRKAKSPDVQNLAETAVAICRWLREDDIATIGAPVARPREDYWAFVHRLCCVAHTRLRAAQMLPVLEARQSANWAVYCWMWVLQCNISENDTPEWFRRQLEMHRNTRLPKKARTYLEVDGDWSIAQKWLDKKESARRRVLQGKNEARQCLSSLQEKEATVMCGQQKEEKEK